MVIDMSGADKLHNFFQTIGEANRLRIISFIGKEERSVSEIVKNTNLSQPLVSHHLRTLKEQGIVQTKRNGPFIFYKLRNPKLLEMLAICAEIAPDIKPSKGRSSMFPFTVGVKRFKVRK